MSWSRRRTPPCRTGLASYSVGGALHNYLALALFLLRVFRGIRRAELSLAYVLSLQASRVLGVVFLHGYGCRNVLPELCEYAAWGMLPSVAALWVQLGFVLSGTVSIVLLSVKGAPAARWQGSVFLATAAMSAGYAALGLGRAEWAGAFLFGVATAFDAYLSQRLIRVVRAP